MTLAGCGTGRFVYRAALASTCTVLAALSVDLVRRVARIDRHVRNSPSAVHDGPPRDGHHIRIALVHFDGTHSHVEFRVNGGSETQLAEVLIDEIELDGRTPLPTSPRRAFTQDASSLILTLSFRDVLWTKRTVPTRFEAPLRYRCRVRHATDAAGVWRKTADTLALQVTSGAAYSALIATLGAPR